MSRFQEFCKSYWIGQTKAGQEHEKQEDEREHLCLAVSELIRRMCAFYQCPGDRAHYVDLETNVVSGSVEAGTPLLCFESGSGRYAVGLEITVGEGHYPVWLKFAFPLPKHSGLEVHFESSLYQLPAEEQAFFSAVADAINGTLREGCPAPPLKVGW